MAAAYILVPPPTAVSRHKREKILQILPVPLRYVNTHYYIGERDQNVDLFL